MTKFTLTSLVTVGLSCCVRLRSAASTDCDTVEVEEEDEEEEDEELETKEIF